MQVEDRGVLVGADVAPVDPHVTRAASAAPKRSAAVTADFAREPGQLRGRAPAGSARSPAAAPPSPPCARRCTSREETLPARARGASRSAARCPERGRSGRCRSAISAVSVQRAGRPRPRPARPASGAGCASTRTCSSASAGGSSPHPDDVTVIVVDPRWTETADLADLHLPLRPGSDIALLNGDAPRARERAADSIGRGSTPTRRDGTTSSARWPSATRRSARPRSPGSPPASSSAPRCRFGAARAALTLWSHGREPEPRGHRQERGDPQPAPGDRTDRPRRRGPVLAHRPAERDGRTGDGWARPSSSGLPAASSDPVARAAVERHWGVPAGTIAPDARRWRARDVRGGSPR